MTQEQIFIKITSEGLPELKAKVELLVAKANEVQELIEEINGMEINIKASLKEKEKQAW